MRGALACVVLALLLRDVDAVQLGRIDVVQLGRVGEAARVLDLEEEIGERMGGIHGARVGRHGRAQAGAFLTGVLARGRHSHKAFHREQQGDMRKDELGLGLALGLVGFGLGGCAAEVDDAPTVAATSPAASSSEPVFCDKTSDETSGEHIGTSMNALTNGQRIAICQAAALVAGSLGCAGVTASCAASSVLTVGSVTIPCVLVIAFACSAYVGGTSVIVTYCPEYVNR